MNQKKIKYPFPFLGAGEANYYDWTSIQVLFKETPSEEQKKQIQEKVPLPIVAISWDNNILIAENEYRIHIDIANTYHTKDGLDPENKEDWKNEDLFLASDSQVNAFNKDIEKWLKYTHEIANIIFAFRETDEVTLFSDWHTYSLNQINSILPYFNDVITNFDFNSANADFLYKVFKMVDDISKFDDKYIPYFYPGIAEFEAFEKGDITLLKKITNTNYLKKTIAYFNSKLKNKHKKNIIKHINVFLEFGNVIPGRSFNRLNQFLFNAIEDVKSDAFKKIACNITDLSFIDSIADQGYILMTQKKFKESIILFKKVLAVSIEPSVRSGFYTNILWVFQKDNTGFAINKELNLLALEKCIPKASEYAAIFFNACCIYTEMGQYQKAYEMVEEAIANFYDKKYMLKEIRSEDMFKQFREKTSVLDLLEKYNSEPTTNPTPRFIEESIAYNRFYVHDVYNNGFAIPYTIILINGHVTINGEFNDVYKALIIESDEQHLVIVNGNITANSISKNNTLIHVMGKINCKNVSHEKLKEMGKENFSYVPMTLK